MWALALISLLLDQDQKKGTNSVRESGFSPIPPVDPLLAPVFPSLSVRFLLGFFYNGILHTWWLSPPERATQEEKVLRTQKVF